MADTQVTMEELVALCKTRGFVYPGSDLYGGMANSWDYGPLGVALKNNIKLEWWKMFVDQRLDVVGIDAALIMNPKVWEASGHLNTFHDPLVEDKKTHRRYRADTLLEENGIDPTGMSLEDIKNAITENGITSPDGNELTDPVEFNLMFKTYFGVTETPENAAYFRPETAQAMFVNFPLVVTSSRKRVPFGIAQIGKAFRNEITPGNFIFRTREFEQMEIEYFVSPDAWEASFEDWLAQIKQWIAHCGIDEGRISELEVPEEERAHYSDRTVDIEFDFPFGRKELYGLAYRTDYDLRSHAEASGKDLRYTDPQSGEKYLPHVIEPSLGVDRTMLAVLLSAYTVEEAPTADGGVDTRVVMKFKKAFAPIKAAVLPLSKKEELTSVAKPLAERLAKRFAVDYDETQSIGKRYRRQDEIGTPYCITVDFDTAADNSVTVRDRDSMEQSRVNIEDLEAWLKEHLAN